MATETPSTGRDSDKFMLRFPDGMRDRLKEAAKANNRTMNAEIIDRLDRSFAAIDMGLHGDPLDHLGKMSLMLSMLLNERIHGKTRDEIAALAKEATQAINSKLALVSGPNQVVLDKDRLSKPPRKN